MCGHLVTAHSLFRCVECDLRADCIIKIEVDCPLTGGSGGIGSASVVAGGGGAPADRHQSSGLRAAVSRKAYRSVMEKSPIIWSAKKCSGIRISLLLL
eukprot:TsM_001235100 transcript=TsM_001235100 gene=TsM_001235100